MRWLPIFVALFAFLLFVDALPTDSLDARAPAKKKPKTPPKKPVKPPTKPNKPPVKPKPTTNPVKPKPVTKPSANIVKCDPISKYTVAWFQKNTCKQPKKDACLFYTKGLSALANSYAKQQTPRLTTIWEMWSKEYFVKTQVKSNPLRCIMQGKATRAKYFQTMSRSMATLCSGDATVMDRGVSPNTATFEAVNQSGIWYNVEFPQLQTGNGAKRVDKVKAISKDGKTAFTYWTRPGARAQRDLIGRDYDENDLHIPPVEEGEDEWYEEDWEEVDEEHEHDEEGHSVEARAPKPKPKKCVAVTSKEIGGIPELN